MNGTLEATIANLLRGSAGLNLPKSNHELADFLGKGANACNLIPGVPGDGVHPLLRVHHVELLLRAAGATQISLKRTLARTIRHLEGDHDQITRRVEIVIDRWDPIIMSKIKTIAAICRQRSIQLEASLLITENGYSIPLPLP